MTEFILLYRDHIFLEHYQNQHDTYTSPVVLSLNYNEMYPLTPPHSHLRIFIVALGNFIVGNVDKTHLPLLVLQLGVKDLKAENRSFSLLKSLPESRLLTNKYTLQKCGFSRLRPTLCGWKNCLSAWPKRWKWFEMLLTCTDHASYHSFTSAKQSEHVLYLLKEPLGGALSQYHFCSCARWHSTGSN